EHATALPLARVDLPAARTVRRGDEPVRRIEAGEAAARRPQVDVELGPPVVEPVQLTHVGEALLGEEVAREHVLPATRVADRPVTAAALGEDAVPVREVEVAQLGDPVRLVEDRPREAVDAVLDL